MVAGLSFSDEKAFIELFMKTRKVEMCAANITIAVYEMFTPTSKTCPMNIFWGLKIRYDTNEVQFIRYFFNREVIPNAITSTINRRTIYVLFFYEYTFIVYGISVPHPEIRNTHCPGYFFH